MAIKRRKGKKSKSSNGANHTNAKTNNKPEAEIEEYNAGKDKISKQASDKKVRTKPARVRKKASLKSLLLFFIGIFCAVGAVLYHYYSRYGSAVILGQGWKDFKWTPYMWRKFIDENEKTILLIGGPHRSGTTILWEGIKAHPEIVGFGDTFETGVDYSEGVLMQEIYPRFGVGVEFKKNFGVGNKASGEDDEKSDGMGRYALHPKVHWTKENKKEKLEDPTNFSKLLNRFAPYWDQNKKFEKDGLVKAKVWVEKSPQNGVLSTFLEGLYNIPVNEDGSVDLSSAKKPKRSATKFLFMTRHPIANCYAIDKFVKESMGGYIDFEILLRNYIQLHKYMKMDEKALNSATMWATLEDFTSNPSKVLKEIFRFLKVSSDDEVVSGILDSIRGVSLDPNKKYMKEWCEKGIFDHGHLLEKYAKELKALDLKYDMNVC